jgi:hypothetical protein
MQMKLLFSRYQTRLIFMTRVSKGRKNVEKSFILKLRRTLFHFKTFSTADKEIIYKSLIIPENLKSVNIVLGRFHLIM